MSVRCGRSDEGISTAAEEKLGVRNVPLVKKVPISSQTNTLVENKIKGILLFS